jgi:hypothetical protein
VATDGSILIAVHDQNATVEGSGVVSLAAPLLKACKPSRRALPVNLAVSDGVATVGDFQQSGAVLDVSFPQLPL